jgi:hypothetical protein
MPHSETLSVPVDVSEAREHLQSLDRLNDQQTANDAVSRALKDALRDFDNTAEDELGLPWIVTPTSTVITGGGPPLEWRVTDIAHPEAQARAKRMGAATDWHDAAVSAVAIINEITGHFDGAPIPATMQTAIDDFQTLLDAARAKE